MTTMRRDPLVDDSLRRLEAAALVVPAVSFLAPSPAIGSARGSSSRRRRGPVARRRSGC